MKKNGIVPLVNINEESLRNKQIKHNLSARKKSIIDQEYLIAEQRFEKFKELYYLLTWRDDD